MREKDVREVSGVKGQGTGKIHYLKIDREHFDRIMKDRVSYQLRFNDRDYRVGDMAVLSETVFSAREMSEGAALKYTGRKLGIVIDSILGAGVKGLVRGYVIFGFSILLEDGRPVDCSRAGVKALGVKTQRSRRGKEKRHDA